VHSVVTDEPSGRCVESVKTRVLPGGTAVWPMVKAKLRLVSESGVSALGSVGVKLPVGSKLPPGSFHETDRTRTPVRPMPLRVPLKTLPLSHLLEASRVMVGSEPTV
jgi:hypothetical protein